MEELINLNIMKFYITKKILKKRKAAAIKLQKLAKEINLQLSEFEEWLNYRNVGKR